MAEGARLFFDSGLESLGSRLAHQAKLEDLKKRSSLPKPTEEAVEAPNQSLDEELLILQEETAAAIGNTAFIDTVVF